MSSFLRFFRDSLTELHQVRWPTRQQAIRLTVISIVFILASSAALGLVDAGLTQVIRSTL